MKQTPTLNVSGYAYVEILIAVVILGISLAPMMDSLALAVRHQQQYSAQQALFAHTSARMQEVLNESYSELDAAAAAAGSGVTPSNYSDGAGSPNRRLVFLARYDQDNADGDNNPITGGDPGVVWIRVVSELGMFDLQSLRAQP